MAGSVFLDPNQNFPIAHWLESSATQNLGDDLVFFACPKRSGGDEKLYPIALDTNDARSPFGPGRISLISMGEGWF